MNHVQIVEQEYQAKLAAAKRKDAAKAALAKLGTQFDPNIVALGDFKGHPTISFGSKQEGDRPFSFGVAKANAFMDAVDKYGADSVIDLIRTLAGRK